MAHLPTALLALNALLFFLLEVTAAEQKNITAESGQNVTLTCRAPDEKNDGVDCSRGDLLCRDGKFNPDQHHPSSVNRVDLQDKLVKDGDVSVILNNVTINDTGTHKCCVMYESWTNISIIYLRVVAPPGPTGGTTEDGGKEDGGKEDARTEDGGKKDARKEDRGKEDGSDRAGLSLSAVLLLLFLAVVVLLIYSKRLQQQRQGSSL